MRIVNDFRAWAMAHKVRSLLLGVVVLTVMSLTLMAWTYLAESVVGPQEVITLPMALEALDAGDHEKAKRLVRRLQEQPLAPRDYGGPPYVLGVIKAVEANGLKQSQQQSAYLVASHYLQLALLRGFPRERAADGQYLLARSLVLSGQHADAIDQLENALEMNPHRATELHQLFVTSLINLPNPDHERALEHNSQLLSDIGLPSKQRLQALLDRGRILLALDQPKECRGVIDSIEVALTKQPGSSSLPGEAAILKAQLLMAEAAQLEDDRAATRDRVALLKDAIKLLTDAQQFGVEGAAVNRQAMYLMGRCYQQMGGDVKDSVKNALGELTRTRNLYLDTPEGVAAALAEGELLLSHQRVDDAVAAFRRALLAAPDPEVYVNRWLSLDALRRRVLQVHDSLVDEERFEAALELLDVFAPIFDRLETIATRADTLMKWGATLLSLAGSRDGLQADALAKQGRIRYRQAGVIYEELADLHFATRQFAQDLWRAAQNYRLGHSFSRQVGALKRYLREEAVTQRPQALAELGAAQLSLRQFEDAIEVLEECIEFHAEDPAVYEARITCSSAYRELGNYQRAEQLLLANLAGGALFPTSPEWRDSLFQYGFLLHEQGRYQEAIGKLGEAVERYPDAEHALLGRYMIADSHRHSARAPLARVEQVATENERIKNRRLAREHLLSALAHYESVQKTLTISSDLQLPPLDAAVLRNCYLMRGSILMDLKQYAEALDVFRNASSLYQNDPVVLEAYVQISHCHRRLGQDPEARGALDQAKVVLAKLPPDADFLAATSFNRTEWLELLDQMSQW